MVSSRGMFIGSNSSNVRATDEPPFPSCASGFSTKPCRNAEIFLLFLCKEASLTGRTPCSGGGFKNGNDEEYPDPSGVCCPFRDSHPCLLKHAILIDGRPYSVDVTGGRHASPGLLHRKESHRCQPKTTRPLSGGFMKRCFIREMSPQ